MNRILMLCALCVIFVVAATTYGDMGRPLPAPAAEKMVLRTGLQVVPEVDGYRGARLQISQETLNELRTAIAAGNTTPPSFTERLANNPANTIVAGVLMFASLSFAGIWLLRASRQPGTRASRAAAAIVVIIAVAGAAAVVTRGNAGPPPSLEWRNLTKNLNSGKATNGGLDIEVVPNGQGMKLIMPVRRSNASD